MHDDWERVRLGQLIRLEYGKALPAKDREEGTFPVVGSAGIVGYHREPLVHGPTIVVGRKGTAGRVVSVPESCWPIDTTFFVVNASEGKLTREYEHLLLLSSGLEDLVTATGVPGLSRDRALEQTVLLPPTDEQRRIADLLSHVDKVFTAMERSSQYLARLGDAIAHRVWSSDFQRLRVGDLGEATTGRTPRTSEKTYWDSSDIPFVTPGDLGGLLSVSDAERYVSHAGAAAARMLPVGAVMQVCIGATIGKAGLSATPLVTNQQINSVSGLREADAYLLAFLLNSAVGRRELMSKAGKTAVPIVNKSQWAESQVPWPSDRERATLGATARAIDEALSGLRLNLERARSVRSAALSLLLSGTHEIPVSYDRFLEEMA